MNSIRCKTKYEFDFILNHLLKQGYVESPSFKTVYYDLSSHFIGGFCIYLYVIKKNIHWASFYMKNDEEKFIDAKYIIRKIKLNNITDDK